MRDDSAAVPAGAPPPGGGSRPRVLWLVLFSGLLIVASIAVVMLIPLFHTDYRVRARISEAHAIARMQSQSVADFRSREQRCPRNGEDGFGTPESYATNYIATLRLESSGSDCVVRVALHSLGDSSLGAVELRMTLDSDLNWTDRANLPDNELPLGLRSTHGPRIGPVRDRRGSGRGGAALGGEGDQHRGDGRGDDQGGQGQ